ncbi:hypothetical protein GQ44DRAFT_655666 [Phaeosphaeriaceae sp. PMI808]|nr:hypothetical protein GQ44DRAFT_655666 [Phaeosphaeriaceae sp. PMI808]
MIVSDMMPSSSAPSAQEKLGPAIPSRRSSISRTNSTVPKDKQRTAARHSLLNDNGCQLNLSNNDNRTSSVQPHPVKRAHSTSKMVEKPTRSSKSASQSTKIQRWAGLTRSVCDWDGLRKDPELWVQDGDCFVHLYGHGASQRGPSFCVPLRALRQKNCGPILDVCFAQTVVEGSTAQKSKRMQSFDNLHRGSTPVELYIPAPDNTSREQSYNWHITTRNFFAYVLGKPLVGCQMGGAFVDLHERMNLFRSKYANNHQDFLEYAENQGYRDLVECTDYALASLYYAERYKLKEVWLDAFAHCVGMSDSVALSPDYIPISRLTKALISRANREIYIHLNRVSKALRTFLQDDFSPAHFGLADEARNHLNSFQRFLHQFYAEKFGYWPPPKSASNFPKPLYQSMFYDFKNLYDLLVDAQSNTDLSSQSPASGGICVLQNVDNFDKRHKFTAQLHPLPLLPARSQHQKSGRSSVSSQKTRDTQFKKNALVMATNNLDENIANSQIVQAYMDFEKTSVDNTTQRESKLTTVDARKLRWLLIYGTLQYLTSALQAPSAVRDTDSPEYPLCCLVAGQASWNAGTPALTPRASNPISTPQVTSDCSGENSPYSIQPDCQREDYFSSQDPARFSNAEASVSVKTHLPSRQSSLRSLGPLSSLSARALRSNSLRLKPTQHSSAIIRGYSDGPNRASTRPSTPMSPTQKDRNVSDRPKTASPQQEFNLKASDSYRQSPSLPTKPTSVGEGRGHNRTRTPLLHTCQLNAFVIPILEANDLNESMCRSDSTSSMVSSVWTDGGSAASSKSSADGERLPFYKTSTSEHNGLLGGLVSVDGTRVSLDASAHSTSTVCPPQKDINPLLQNGPTNQEDFQFRFSAQNEQEVKPVGMDFTTPSIPQMPANSIFHTLETKADTNPNAIPDVVKSKKSRSSDILSGLVMKPNELRGLYNGALKRLESTGRNSLQPLDTSDGSKPNIQTTMATKISHATRIPSIRGRHKNDNGKDGKKEKRLSLTWRR